MAIAVSSQANGQCAILMSALQRKAIDSIMLLASGASKYQSNSSNDLGELKSWATRKLKLWRTRKLCCHFLGGAVVIAVVIDF